MTIKRGVDLVLAGALWGVCAYLLGRRAYGVAIWPGLFAAPAIGLVVGATMQPWFERATEARRKLVALLSLYFAATLFGLVIGLGSWLGVSPGTRRFPAALVEPILSTWWGITLTGFFIALWPLAYLTQWALAWRAERSAVTGS